MNNNHSVELAKVDEPKELSTVIVVLTKEQVQAALGKLFFALEDATGNGLTAIDIITKIAEGIESNPEFSKQILTPDNIEKAYALKAKSDLGTITLNDIENAFPIIAEKVPFWFMLKSFKF